MAGKMKKLNINTKQALKDKLAKKVTKAKGKY